ncbi:MAG: phage tail protein [Bacteroidia bacterium]|nr:phage tail protein [Bacteroidia bacterium]
MKKIDFTYPGGYPLVQESLGFMQDAYTDAIKALSLSLDISGSPTGKAVILSGCEVTIVSGNISIAAGYVAWNTGEIMPVMPVTLTYILGSPLYLIRKTAPHASMDPTYFAMSGQVQDVHINSFCEVSYTPSGTHLPFLEQYRYRNMVRDYGTPLASIIAYGGQISSIPSNWKLCDGSTLNYNLNPEFQSLFGVIGTIHGAGVSVGDFKLPDLRDRFILGASPTHSVATSGGDDEITLVEANLPPHSHAIDNDGEHIHGAKFPNVTMVGVNVGTGDPAADSDFANSFWKDTAVAGDHNHGGETGDGNGTSTPIQHLPPYVALCYIIRVY